MGEKRAKKMDRIKNVPINLSKITNTFIHIWTIVFYPFRHYAKNGRNIA